ncbi:MAG TPA: flavin reductase family protein [Blastocatellia bacterium]|nr:flavin reductase family protein [Blastocatellia bacterium]
MPVDKDEFRLVMSQFASGVTVVTARCDDDKLRGLTVSAFTSLSLEPPLILVCLDKRASLHDHLKVDMYFAVNILAEEQESVSRRFASKEEDRFNGLGYREAPRGSPLLEGAVASVECRLVSVYPGGDHTIFVGEVDSSVVNGGSPLAYFRGGYVHLAEE